MNTQVSIIEPETLEYLPAKTLLRLIEQSQKVKKWTEAHQSLVRSFPALFRRLEALDVEPSFNLRDGDVELSFTGDGHRLAEVWKTLRQAGYKPSTHPEKGSNASFYTRWLQEGRTDIWMSFSSSVCKRVKVGTKLVEQDVFELQCGELPELESGDKPVAVVEDSDDMPF